MRFATPWLLGLLPLVVAAAWHVARRRARADARLGLPAAAVRRRLGRSPWVAIERALPWVRGVVLALLVVGLARPQAGETVREVSTLGVDVVVALDVSRSMSAQDFMPDNRLEVARRTVARFVEGRPGDRIGLVVFAAVPATRCPLTLDHALLRTFLDAVDFAPPDQDGTAIGLGLAAGVNRLRASDARSRVVILVTDGINNRGSVGPMAAAEAAATLGIRVYTIGVGSDGPVPIPIGGTLVQQRLEIDEELLRQVADATGGRYFRATDPGALADVFDEIGRLEPSRIESRERVLYTELFAWFLSPGVVLLLGERLLAGTRARRLP